MGSEPTRGARALLTPALVIHNDFLVRKAQGLYLEDDRGRRYLDFTSGLATTNTGHNHPRVVAAIRRQAEALVHSGCMFYHEPLLELAETLARITPEGLNRFFFSNSGAEAVEGALKLARFHTGRPGILAFAPSFHGRTLGALSLTSSNARYRGRYGPLLPAVHHAPYPYCYRCRLGRDPGACGQECLGHVEWIFRHLMPAEEFACAVIEPVLGEGGYVVPPAPFLHGLRQLCDRWGILLVFDEVQSGMGRTGRWFAGEHFGVAPDILTLAKGIASGLPLSAVVSRPEIMDAWPPGAHGTTFGGNPVSCAAAVATVRVIEEEGLLESAATLGRRALERLRALPTTHACVGDVRGLGLMIGIEFVREGTEPFPEAVQQVLRRSLERGLVLLECGTAKNVIRLAPPLVLRPEELDQALDILEDAVAEVAAGAR
ncbi:MAG: aspartate aminotransferase family protein [Proteobacteria bacterium]|nr:aspartate aminotransferase family protein [Pseudomonadota bacterium]